MITPEPGKTVQIGQRLLALADHPSQVQWVTWPAPGGYSIPIDLFTKFDTDGEDVAEPEAEVPTRRRRRAKASTDNDTSEEE